MIEYGPVPPHVAAAKAVVQEWLDGEDAAVRAARDREPTAAQRFDAIRTQQVQAASEGRALPVAPAPVVVAAQVEPSNMSSAQRWALMRATDQSTMKPYQRAS